MANHAGEGEDMSEREGECVGKGAQQTIVSDDQIAATSPSAACVLTKDAAVLTSTERSAKWRAAQKQTKEAQQLKDLAQRESERRTEQIAVAEIQEPETDEQADVHMPADDWVEPEKKKKWNVGQTIRLILCACHATMLSFLFCTCSFPCYSFPCCPTTSLSRYFPTDAGRGYSPFAAARPHFDYCCVCA